MKRPVLFLDRDEVMNLDHGYVHRSAEVVFLDGIFELGVEAKRSGYLVVVVTNQAGIGRGYFSEPDFHELMDCMKSKFVEPGGQIDAVYFCPCCPVLDIGECRPESDCRKPAPGMLLHAERELDIDMERSILIVDKPSDMAAGGRACFAFGAMDEIPLSIPIRHLSDVLPLISF